MNDKDILLLMSLVSLLFGGFYLVSQFFGIPLMSFAGGAVTTSTSGNQVEVTYSPPLDVSAPFNVVVRVIENGEVVYSTDLTVSSHLPVSVLVNHGDTVLFKCIKNGELIDSKTYQVV